MGIYTKRRKRYKNKMLKSLKEWDHVGTWVKFFLSDLVPDWVRGWVSAFLHLARSWTGCAYPTMYPIGYDVG